MVKRIPVLFAAYTVFIIACSGNENTSNTATSENKEQVVKNTRAATHESPCEFISEAHVRKMFTVPDEISIKMEDRVLTYPTCSFEWEDGKVVSTMKVGSQEIELKKPSEVMIVMVKDARQSMYETAIKVYKDIETLENIGEMASWGGQMSQLSFLANNHLFHVHVKASNDDTENRAKAIEVARLILGQL